VIELLIRLRNSMGLAMLFVTHNLPLIRTIADRVAVMSRGRIVELGMTQAVFEAPQADYTRELLANTAGFDFSAAAGPSEAPPPRPSDRGQAPARPSG